MADFEIFDRQLLLNNHIRYRGLFEKYNFLYLKCTNIILENIEIQNRVFNDIFEINRKTDIFATYFNQKNFNNCEFNEIYDENLINFGENKYDLVLNVLDLHYINDVRKFLYNVKKSLKPKGLFIASFVGDENLPELRKSMLYAENKIYNGTSPRLPPTIDIKSSARLLSQMGFKNPISDLETIIIDYDSPLELLRDIKFSGQGNILINRSKKFFTKKLFNNLLDEYQNFYNSATKSYPATFKIITISGEA